MKSIFITGTGTSVGKTVVTAGYAYLLQKNGYKVGVMKPVQTGAVDLNGHLHSMDMDFIESVMLMPQTIDRPDLKTPVLLHLSASPHLAAENESIKIDPQLIINTYDLIRHDYNPDYLLIEGAGGLYVPITRDYFMFNLIAALHAQVILVADAGLGTINHTMLSIDLLNKHALPFNGVVFNRASEPLSAMEMDNIKTIGNISGSLVKAIVPVIHGLDVDSAETGAIRKVFDALQIDEFMHNYI